ncbi:MAG: hypothetical protein AAF840_05260, partial [Bacteroidota bacterium]
KFNNLRPPLRDSSNILWFGSSGRGLLKVDLRKKRFKHYLPGRSLRDPINIDATGTVAATTNFVTGFYADEGHGLSKVVMADFKDFRLTIDRNGTEWSVYCKQDALVIRQRKSGGVWVSLLEATLPAGSFIGLTNVIVGPRGFLWVADQDRLHRYDPEDNELESYLFPSTLSSRKQTMRLAVAKDGTIWIATTDGLLRGQVAGKEVNFKRYGTSIR